MPLQAQALFRCVCVCVCEVGDEGGACAAFMWLCALKCVCVCVCVCARVLNHTSTLLTHLLLFLFRPPSTGPPPPLEGLEAAKPKEFRDINQVCVCARARVCVCGGDCVSVGVSVRACIE